MRLIRASEYAEEDQRVVTFRRVVSNGSVSKKGAITMDTVSNILFNRY